MPQARSPRLVPVPRGLVLVGSGVILFHLTAVIVSVLATPSGPWSPIPGMPPTKYEPPHFAKLISGPILYVHSRALKMASGYNFQSNRLMIPLGVYFEANLYYDKGGGSVTQLRFPDPKANPWVRHRQQILARGLAEDLPMEPRLRETSFPLPVRPRGRSGSGNDPLPGHC